MVATSQCPACGLTVPYFCCEGLVCPACGYDEDQNVSPKHDAAQRNMLQLASQKSSPADSRAPRPPVQ
jgi:uncharacterized Zn finger protein (UPF0148 family)